MNKPDASKHAAAALAYATRGWPVFPVHSAGQQAGVIVCSCSKGVRCDRPGKHPRTKNGLKAATTDADIITAWWKTWPRASIGIRTGGNLMVLDIDPGRHGDESLGELEKEHGKLPETYTVLTGGGGQHYYLRGDSVPSSVDTAGWDGMDIRGDGGYVIAPPSSHASGSVYEVDAGGADEPSPAPEWLLKLAKGKRRKVTPKAVADVLVQSARNTHLTSLAGTLRRRGLGESVILTALLAENQDRCRPPLDEVEVRRVAHSVAKYEPAKGIVDPGSDDDWRHDLRLRQDGAITTDPGNAVVLMSNMEEWQGVLCRDDFANKIVWVKDPPPISSIGAMPGPKAGDDIKDSDVIYVHHWFAKTQGVCFSRDALLLAMDQVARSMETNPVREWLESLVWDGKERVEGWLTDYLGVARSDYSLAVGEWWLISAVARIYKPGCKVDHMLVLEGEQGVGKTWAMETLVGNDWFLRELSDVGQKDAVGDLIGRWVACIPELESIKGVRATKVKSFLSRTVDDWRPPYGRFNVTRKRQCIFVADTNEHRQGYLMDPTGARRFWPVEVGKCDIDALRIDRAQIWAEVVEKFKSGCQWWPTPDMNRVLREEQAARYAGDAWESEITRWCLNGGNWRQNITIGQCLLEAVGMSKDKWDRKSQMRCSAALGRMGYRKVRAPRNMSGKRNWVWRRDGQPNEG